MQQSQSPLYIRSQTAAIIQKEWERVVTIIKRDNLYPEQTIWSIMVIYWYEYYDTDEKRYRQDNRRNSNVNMLSKNELKKAKMEHIVYKYNVKIQQRENENKNENENNNNKDKDKDKDKEYDELLRLKNAHMKHIYHMEDICNNLRKKHLEYSLWIDYTNAFYSTAAKL